MGLLSNFVQAQSRETEPAPIVTGAEFLGSFLTPSAGIPVDANVALTYSGIWRGVTVISDNLSSLPFHAFSREGETRNIIPDHPVTQLLSFETNPEMGSRSFRWGMQAVALLKGAGFAEIERTNGGAVKWLWPINPDMVTPMRLPESNAIVYRVRGAQGGSKDIPATDMFHLRARTLDGISGLSSVMQGKEAISLGLAMERFGSTFFSNGANVGGVLFTQKVVGAEGAQKIESDWIKSHAGNRNSHKPVVLQDGMDWKPTAVTPEDSQLIEERTYQIQEAARFIGVQPHKLAELSRATFSNLEEQNQEFVQDTIAPWGTAWEEEADRKLFTSTERSIIRTRLDLRGLLRANTEKRAAYYTALFAVGALSINEIRALEDMGPVEGGDLRVISANFVSVERAIAEGSTGTVTQGERLAVVKTELLLGMEKAAQQALAMITQEMTDRIEDGRE